ncbi:radical SAM protein [Desulfobacter latus]|uniref:Radical SAM protein n=1 Tax=Desulfobacter latus TaxID=2292 RepID=A0A850T3I6_9BACT|nr:radical SAM protein [Desulfobacter latus]NWH06930.1 radical SAM protein [Desulfobacter latus]
MKHSIKNRIIKNKNWIIKTINSVLPLNFRFAPLFVFHAHVLFTPKIQSIRPEVLQAFHQQKFKADIIPDNILIKAPSHRLSKNLVLAELLMALGRFETAIALGEKLFERYPNDLRVQDSLCRARYYHRIGKISENPGLEMQGKVCKLLWDDLHLLPDGSVFQCCSVWLRTSIGNALAEPLSQIWQSNLANEIRNSAVNGDYRFCGKLSCGHILDELFPPREHRPKRFISADQLPVQLPPPKLLNLSYDRTCNLSCPSCRTTKFVAKGKELEKVEKITKHVLEVLPEIKRIEVTGSGDPFASRSFRHLLSSINKIDFPNLKVTLMTNGLLLCRSEWDKFKNLHGMIDTINISVDAARAETYRIVRRGGEFKDLLPNLGFIGELVQQGAIKHFRLCFVVQDYNFREMSEFLKLAKHVNAQSVHFQKMHDWGTYTTEQLKKRRVYVSSHQDYPEFIDLIKSLPSQKGLIILSDFTELEAN